MLHYILENQVDSHSYEDVAKPTGLVVVPTRELALQIHQECRKFSLNTIAKSVSIYGGVATNFQMRCMKVIAICLFYQSKMDCAFIVE